MYIDPDILLILVWFITTSIVLFLIMLNKDRIWTVIILTVYLAFKFFPNFIAWLSNTNIYYWISNVT